MSHSLQKKVQKKKFLKNKAQETKSLPILSIKDVSKLYHQGEIKVHALTSINLSFHEGEFAALVGPSGSGKTTLLNLIGALDSPTSGSIALNDTQFSDLNEQALSQFRLFEIGFIFQAYNLVPVLSALENVELVMVLQNRPSSERRERALHYLNLVGLSDLIHRRPSALSGGQQQRVAVARALAAGPRLVLADEPTANLDSENASALLTIMHTLAKEEKTTFIFSTHDIRVMERAERIITLEDGHIKSDKTV